MRGGGEGLKIFQGAKIFGEDPSVSELGRLIHEGHIGYGLVGVGADLWGSSGIVNESQCDI